MYSPLKSRACHEYRHDANQGLWYVKSKECQNQVPNARPCCEKCLDLASPKKVQRLVVRFVAKYHAARLLRYKLFGTPEQVADLLAEIEKSQFGLNNNAYWKKLAGLTNSELQAFVRSSFGSIASDLENPALHDFLSMVVAPSLQINVAAVDSSMVQLSSQFVGALASQKLNDTGQI